MNQMAPIEMSGQTLVAPQTCVRSPVFSQRAARRDELGYVHARLVETIEGMESFSPEFRAFECARLSKLFLVNLHTLDPNYVRVCFTDDEMVGFIVSGPEHGTLWYYWCYVFPEVRAPKMAMVFLRQYLEYWDNGRFHKVSLYTTHSNKPARALLKRFGFEHKCDLEDHVMGQDFMLFERPLTKVQPGYDEGTTVPFKTRLMNRIRCALRLV